MEGLTRAYFSPRHPKDGSFEEWLYSGGRGGVLPLMIAVTSRRIMLFKLVRVTLRRYCFIPLDDIEYLQPPKPALWGTSGPLRFGLKSGREYQLKFLGPLLNPEAMQYEQKLAAYLRELAPRYAASQAA